MFAELVNSLTTLGISTGPKLKARSKATPPQTAMSNARWVEERITGLPPRFGLRAAAAVTRARTSTPKAAGLRPAAARPRASRTIRPRVGEAGAFRRSVATAAFMAMMGCK